MKGDFIRGKLREQMKIDLELQSSKQVLEYLGRYTRRVAISNHRLVKVEDGKVTLSKSDIMGCSATAIEKTSSSKVTNLSFICAPTSEAILIVSRHNVGSRSITDIEVWNHYKIKFKEEKNV